MTRGRRFAFVPVLAILAVQAAAAAAGVPSGYPLLVNQHGLRVYGPANGAKVGCPTRVAALPTDALRTAKRALVLAMPLLEARLHLDGRDAQVRVTPAMRSRFDAAAGGCGRTVWGLSIVATVRLPHVVGASMAQHTFAVARIYGGWVIYAWITG